MARNPIRSYPVIHVGRPMLDLPAHANRHAFVLSQFTRFAVPLSTQHPAFPIHLTACRPNRASSSLPFRSHVQPCFIPRETPLVRIVHTCVPLPHSLPSTRRTRYETPSNKIEYRSRCSRRASQMRSLPRLDTVRRCQLLLSGWQQVEA